MEARSQQVREWKTKPTAANKRQFCKKLSPSGHGVSTTALTAESRHPDHRFWLDLTTESHQSDRPRLTPSLPSQALIVGDR